MKRCITFIIALAVVFVLNTFSPRVLAADTSTPPAPVNEIEQSKKGLGGALDLFKGAAKPAGFKGEPQLPEVVVGGYIQSALILVGTIFGMLVVYAGYLWMTARGNEKYVEKAKSILINASIGIVLVMGAYAITAFIVNRVVQSAQFGTP